MVKRSTQNPREQELLEDNKSLRRRIESDEQALQQNVTRFRELSGEIATLKQEKIEAEARVQVLTAEVQHLNFRLAEYEGYCARVDQEDKARHGTAEDTSSQVYSRSVWPERRIGGSGPLTPWKFEAVNTPSATLKRGGRIG